MASQLDLRSIQLLQCTKGAEWGWRRQGRASIAPPAISPAAAITSTHPQPTCCLAASPAAALAAALAAARWCRSTSRRLQLSRLASISARSCLECWSSFCAAASRSASSCGTVGGGEAGMPPGGVVAASGLPPASGLAELRGVSCMSTVAGQRQNADLRLRPFNRMIVPAGCNRFPDRAAQPDFDALLTELYVLRYFCFARCQTPIPSPLSAG